MQVEVIEFSFQYVAKVGFFAQVFSQSEAKCGFLCCVFTRFYNELLNKQ